MKRRLLARGIPFLLLGIFLGLCLPSLQALPEKIYKSLDLFSKVLYLVDRDYVEPVDGENLVYGAIKGMLGTLDPYTVFLTPDVYKELKVDTLGRFGGVGLEITLKEGVLTVLTPIEDTPAARAGVQPGDRILKINGVLTKGMDLADAVRRMRGSRHSTVHLTLYREGIKKPFDVVLKRDVIQVKSVKAELLPGSIAYLRLTSFQENTTQEFKQALTQLQQQAGKEAIKAYLLDLRSNPGGLLEEAVGVSDLFLSEGVIVSTRGRQGDEEVRRATKNPEDLTTPIVILLDEGSASASEIVAAALRDNQRAKIFGKKSFGKASVQTVIDLGEETGLKITIAHYYTPSGKSISGKGIEPDFEVNNPEGNQSFLVFDPKKDLQRQAALDYLREGKIPPKPVSTENQDENKVKEQLKDEE